MKYFWFGFLIYTLDYTLMISGITLSNITTVLQVLGFGLMLLTAPNIFTLSNNSAYLRITVTLFLSWSLIILVRGINFKYEFLRELITDGSLGILMYLTPFFIFLNFKIRNINIISNLIILLGFSYLILISISVMSIINPLNIQGQIILEYLSRFLIIPVTYIILTYPFQTKKKKVISFIFIIVALAFAIIRARRGLIFNLLLPVIFAYILNVKNSTKKVKPIIITVILLSLILTVLTKISIDKNSTLYLLSERLYQDTRTQVEQYFYDDLTDLEFFIGKGINGKYYCPIGLTPDGKRAVIETGYLQIILNGGLIWLILFVLIAVPAIFLGLNKSNNQLSKASALWVLIFILNSYPSTVTSFSLNYVLFWISISICYDAKIRGFTDAEIKNNIAF
ncbi:O-antigen polymerase [Saccharicrinis sp. FJH54]|uniref:O-antigen polymerase n=1 Tax=Saccharicrinis sp. FJH54 TaxID=3344665 RepID=UPI0035D47EA5